MVRICVGCGVQFEHTTGKLYCDTCVDKGVNVACDVCGCKLTVSKEVHGRARRRGVLKFRCSGCANILPLTAESLMGKTFGCWEVLKLTDKRNNRFEILWECRCSCGEVELMSRRSLGKAAKKCTHNNNDKTVKFAEVVILYKAKLLSMENALTLSGFNSKSSFYAAIKELQQGKAALPDDYLRFLYGYTRERKHYELPDGVRRAYTACLGKLAKTEQEQGKLKVNMSLYHDIKSVGQSLSQGVCDYRNYVVYSDGRIFSKLCGQFIADVSNADGKLVLKIKDKTEEFYVSQVVACCFVENLMPVKWNYIYFMDGNKSNVCADNIQWCA